MKKKLLSVVMTVALVATMLIGCGESTTGGRRGSK